MAKLTIGNQTVTVGDEFLRMSPEQQQATVDEIAASIGVAAPQEDPLAAASRMSQFGPGMDTAAPALPVQQPGSPDILGSTAATLGGLVSGIPVVGPAIQGTSDAILGGASALMGGDYGETVRGLQGRRAELAAANPVANIAGQVAAPIGAFGAAAKIPAAASALGLTGSLGQQVLSGGITNALISSADAAVRGGDTLTGAAIGGATGVAGPLIGRGVETASRALGNKVAPIFESVRNPTGEAARRVGMAVARDVQANPQSIMSAADEAVARQSGLPLINIDRGGETTRALARSVANQSPEARAAIQRTVEDRFSSQAPRAVDFIKQLTGGAVDDLGYQQSIKNVAAAVNKPRYDAARNKPEARAIWNTPIRDLMQSDAFRAAVNAAESTGSNKAAISGFGAVKNPFNFDENGVAKLRMKSDPFREAVIKAQEQARRAQVTGDLADIQAANNNLNKTTSLLEEALKTDGPIALPSLDFWNQVKINLGDAEGAAIRQGNTAFASDLGQMRRKLVDALDAAVPEYQLARQGAASFFDAEDALEAGKKFATQPRAIPEATQAFSRFNGAEKQAFATGYASELIDRIKASSDRRNIIQQVFGSPAAREMNELVFGKAKAQQLEAFVRVEALADMLRGAMGNSTTARQLMELGIGGGAGFALSGDWMGALTGAAVAKGGRYLGEKVDAKVMQEVARLLTSDSPQSLQKAVYNAALSPKWMEAVKALGNSVQGAIMTSPMTTNVQ